MLSFLKLFIHQNLLDNRFVNGKIMMAGMYSKVTKKKIDDVEINKINWINHSDWCL